MSILTQTDAQKAEFLVAGMAAGLASASALAIERARIDAGVGGVGAVADDLALGAGSFILRAPQAAADAQTAKAGADAAAAGVVSTLGAATEVAVTEAGGTNYAVDYSAAADGTAGNAVGAPPLTASGVAFATAGGYAVSGAGTATATPAIMRAIPAYDKATGKVKIVPASGTTDANARAIGALAQYQDDANYAYWAWVRESASLQYNRVVAGALSTSQTFTGLGLPTGLASWTLETKSLVDTTKTQTTGNASYTCTVIAPDGTRSSLSTRVSTVFFSPAWGVVARAAGARVQSVIVDTNRSQMARRLLGAETNITALQKAVIPVIATPAVTDRTARQRLMVGTSIYSIELDRSSLLVREFFSATTDTPVASGSGGVTQAGDWTPTYRSAKMSTANYYRLGTTTWAVGSDGLRPTSQGSGTALPAPSNFSAVMLPLPTNYYRRMNGVEVRGKVYIPVGVSTPGIVVAVPGGRTSAQGAGHIVFDFPQGSSTASPRAQRRQLTVGETGDVYQSESIASVGGREIEFLVRMYRPDFIYAEIDGRRIAKGRFYASGELPDFRAATAVGLSIDPGAGDTLGIRWREMTIGPVPAVGSSRYRTLPPEPPAIVPVFSRLAEAPIFDGANTAVTTTPKVLGPCIFPMLDHAAKLGITPIDNYYLYYSTDHEAGSGGVWLKTGPTETGPWTDRPGALAGGRVWIYTTYGTQTEQPQVVYDDDKNRLILITHNGGEGGTPFPSGKQHTTFTYGTDGMAWSGGGIAMASSPALQAAFHQHDGYSLLFRDPLGIVPDWCGFFRLTGGSGDPPVGGTSSFWGSSRSVDAEPGSVVTDMLPLFPAPIARGTAAAPGTAYAEARALYGPNYDPQIIANMGYGSVPFAYRGQRLFFFAPFRSEGVGDGGSKGVLGLVRLGDDMRNMSADLVPIVLTHPLAVGVATVSSVFVRNGILNAYITYQRQYTFLITANLDAPPAGQTWPF